MLRKKEVDEIISKKAEELNRQQIGPDEFRQFVVSHLEQFRKEGNVKDLCSWLENLKCPDIVRAVAVECLGKIAAPSTVPVISEASKRDPCPEVREICIKIVLIIPKRAQAREKFNQACDLLWNLKSDDAVQVFNEIPSIELDGPYAGLSRGLIVYAQGHFENALPEFNSVVADYPWFSDTFIHLGQTYRQLGVENKGNSFPYFQSSIDCFEKAIGLEPRYFFPYIGMARTYLNIMGTPQLEGNEGEREKALSQAERCIKKVLELVPENPDVLMVKATILSNKASSKSDPEKSNLLEDANALVDKVLLSENAYASTLSYAWGFKAKALIGTKSRKYKEAEQFCLEALELGGKDTDRYIFRLLQDAQKNQGKTREAEKTCRGWCDLYPDDPWAYANLGNVLKKRNPEEALVYLTKAYEISREEENEGVINFITPHIANILFERTNYFSALDIINKAPERTLKHPNTKRLRQKIEEKISNRREKSTEVCVEIEEKLKTLTKESPNFIDELNNLHIQLTEESKSDPYNSRIWTDLGRIENERGNFPKAIKFYERALELIDPKDVFSQAITRLNYAIALKNLGEIDEAISQLKQGLSQSIGSIKKAIERELNDAKAKQKSKKKKVRESVRFRNNYTGQIEVHHLDDLKDFVGTLSKELPIGGKLNEIGNEAFFLRAATGVGKTVTIPMHLFLKIWEKRPKDKTPQVFVVEPRIPIAVDETRHMNEIYQEFLLQKEAITTICSHPSVSKNKKDEVSKKIRSVFQIPYSSKNDFSVTLQQLNSFSLPEELVERIYGIYLRRERTDSNQGPFGSITSLGAINFAAPVVFVTTGIFEKRSYEDGFDPQIHRVIIDEAHITLERNPGVEIALGLCRRRGVTVDFMSATVDWGSLKEDLGVKPVDCSEQRYEIEYRNCIGKLEDVIENLIGRYLIKREDISEKLKEWDKKEPPDKRSVGMLIVVNSHLSEHSDTLKFQNKIRSNPEFKDIEVLRLASPVIRDPIQRQEFKERMNAIEQSNGRYVIIATNVVEMGITYPSLDFVVTMDTEYMNVVREAGITLELMPLGLNALKQRAGRCGRKRPGMCFITKEYNEGEGAWYTKLPDNQLTDLSPKPIKYPLMSANLQKLAFLSCMENIQDDSLIEWLRSLKLPSRLEQLSERIKNLKDEREQLREKGLADNAGLTKLGREILKYVGVEDLDFARMAALCDDWKIRPLIIATSALSEFSLDDILHQHTYLPEDRIAKLSIIEKLGPRNELGINPEEIMQVLNSNRSLEDLKENLQGIGVEPYYMSEILSLVKAGYHPRLLEEIVGPKPDILNFDNKMEDYEKAYDNWKDAENLNKDFLHLQKEVVTLDSNSELLALYDIVSYFFNKYHYLFEGKIPLYQYQKAEMTFQKEADDLGLKKHTLKSAIETILKLFEYLDEKIPVRKREVKPDLKPSADELKKLFTYYMFSLSKEQEISALENIYRLAVKFYDPINGRSNLRLNKKVIKELADEFNINMQDLSIIFRRVIQPAWDRYLEDWKSLNFLEYHPFLPPLRPDTRSKVYNHIVMFGYGQERVLRRGGFGYVGEIDRNGRKLHLELNSSRSPLILQGNKIKVLCRTKPGIRPDGKEFLTLTHITYLEEVR